MASLYKRPNSSHWWAKFRIGGKVVRVSTVCEKKRAAKDWLDVHAGKIAEGQPLPVKLDRILFDELRADLSAHYKATGCVKHLDDAERRLKHLDAAFRGWPAVNITPATITAYVVKRQGEKVPKTARQVAPATVNRELAMLRRVLRLAVRNGKLLRVPAFDMLREAPPRAGFVTDEQFQAIARHLEPDVAVAARIGYELGWRLREVLGLTWATVDLDAGVLRLEPGQTKNSDGRLAYVTPELTRALREQHERVRAIEREGKIVRWVFPHLGKGPLRGEQRRSYIKAWRSACNAAGLAGRIVHDLRRSAVRNMERDGVPRSVATKITGHRTEAVYRRYAIVSDADLRDAARRRAQFGHTQRLAGVAASR